MSTSDFQEKIVDAIAVGQQRMTPDHSDSTERVILFVKCTPIATTGTLFLPPSLEAAIRNRVAKELSRRHVPGFIFEAPDIPHNVNGKKLETYVKAVVCGGQEALKKLSVSEVERRQLSWFEKFYEIERVVRSLEKQRARL